ncbi:hypothetical protein ACTZMC_27545, partial [Klebsiella pneumoniae]|uniref:hypothetical protein n=1 Tax=Klebsiella pneumoniae TaxID=573 RepID=UPI003FCF360B
MTGRHGQDLSQPEYPPPQNAYGVEGLDYPPPASPAAILTHANYGDQHDQRNYYQHDTATLHDTDERHLRVDHANTRYGSESQMRNDSANDHRQQPSPDPSMGGGYEDLYDAYLHSSTHSPAISADRRHSYMMTDYN